VDEFLGRLTGLLKYIINRGGGKVSYSGLTAATAQCVETVRQGLGWMVVQGIIKIKKEAGDDITIAVGTSLKDPVGAACLWHEIQSLMAESSAYRKYFRNADKDSLFA
jgi:hypothetical protein